MKYSDRRCKGKNETGRVKSNRGCKGRVEEGIQGEITNTKYILKKIICRPVLRWSYNEKPRAKYQGES